MEKSYQFVKTALVNFKLDSCCWLAPVRVGLLIIGYVNIFIAMISLIGTANESFSPTIMKVEEVILDDLASKPLPILAYATELGFNVLLLAAVYRKDIVLLRVFMYYSIVTIIASTLVYSLVVAAIDLLLVTTVIVSIIFQAYMLILVRSAIVEIKAEQAEANGNVPTQIIFSTLVREKEINEQEKTEPEVQSEPKVESENVQIEEAKKDEETKKDGDTKLETVDEHPNEITIEVKP